MTPDLEPPNMLFLTYLSRDTYDVMSHDSTTVGETEGGGRYDFWSARLPPCKMVTIFLSRNMVDRIVFPFSIFCRIFFFSGFLTLIFICYSYARIFFFHLCCMQFVFSYKRSRDIFFQNPPPPPNLKS